MIRYVGFDEGGPDRFGCMDCSLQFMPPRRDWTGRSASACAAPCRPGLCTTCAGPWRSTWSGSGFEPHVIEVCLGHSLKGVAGTYRQYGYLPEKAKALQAWADELLAAPRDARQAATEASMGGPAGAAAA